MRAILGREIVVATRTLAVGLTAGAIAGLLLAFVLVWAPGVSLLAPLNLYEQTRLFHWALLTAALPWTAVRSAPDERGRALVMMAAFTGLRPSTVIAGKILGRFAVLVVVAMTALPALVMAQQAAAVPLPQVFVDLLPLLGLVLLVAVCSTASSLSVSDPMAAWLGASAVVGLLLLGLARALPGYQGLGIGSAIVGLVAAAWLISGNAGSLRHLGDAHGR